MIYYQEPNAILYQGHALTELPALPSESVDCVMTSPPYWGLRTYKTEPQIWGENLICSHCGAIIEARRDNGTLCILPRETSDKKEQTWLLQQAVRGEISNERGEIPQISEGVTVGTRQSSLEGRDKENTGIQDGDGKGSPQCSEKWRREMRVCNGASSGNGEDDRALSQERRSGASYKCNQGRQSPRESSISGKEGSQRASNLSLLPENICDKLICPHCGGEGLYHCEHEWGADILRLDRGAAKGKTALVGNQLKEISGVSTPQGSFCLKCNAWRGELGLEPTIELYISHLLQIFDEVKRILKKTGTCWVNIDDSYAGSGKGIGSDHGKAVFTDDDIIKLPAIDTPAKSLCLIPSRFALAMVEHGWILRNDIVWYKSNPMPESVKDRFTGTWEHLFFFVKSQRYWFEQQFEPVLLSSLEREKYGWNGAFKGRYTVPWEGREECKDQCYTNPLGRNKRDVWQINTEPTAQWHGIKNFATFPEKLCETPILSGCPSQICKKCGKAREKVYERETNWQDRKAAGASQNGGGSPDALAYGATCKHGKGMTHDLDSLSIELKGYTDCGCNAGWTAGVVFDPFCGSGKALSVAKRLGRKAIGIDLNPDYCKLAVKELQKISMPMEL